MKKTTASSRRRNILWDTQIDELAQNLVWDKKLKGGVSELLARLVIAEGKRKRGIAHLHERHLPQ